MASPGNKVIKATLLGVAGSLLFAFPLLSIANKNRLVTGIPVLYVYVFGVWVVIIACLILLAEYREGSKNKGKNE